MKSVVTAEGAVDARAAHQPWMGALVPRSLSQKDFAGPLGLPADRTQLAGPWLGERALDGVLALVFVTASAALGWAGAVLL